MYRKPGDFLKFVSSQPLGGFAGFEDPDTGRMRRSPLHPDAMRSVKVENKEQFEAHVKNILFLRRGWVTRAVAINTVPALIVESSYVKPISIINPSFSSSGNQPSIESAWEARIENASGNNQANFLSLANYLYMHIFCSVTACTGSWTFYSQARNLATGNWADTEKLWSGVDAPEELYSIDQVFPVPATRALRWVMNVPGQISFSLSYVLKEFIGGTSTGLPETLFIGSNEGVSIVSGFPVPGGDSVSFILDENVPIWGVARTPITINVFEF